MSNEDNTGRMKCENCVFYKSNINNIGNCHHRSPTRNNYWPEVYETDYCGEFANRIEVLFYDDDEVTTYHRKIVSKSRTDESN